MIKWAARAASHSSRSLLGEAALYHDLDIYMYFLSNGRRTENLFLGVVTKKGKQGHWVRYWDNGNKKDEGFYINSKKDGLWIEWKEDGYKFAEIFYENGVATHLTNCIVENCP